MKRRKGYIYTNKKHTQFGIMSTILGSLASMTLGIAVYLSYVQKGQADSRCGTAAVLAVVYMIIGMGLGLFSTTEKDKFKLFSIIGIAANVLGFVLLSLILYAGAYVN